MKKIMIIAALLLTIVATSFAAPVKMIREDRVWEYINETVYIYGDSVTYEQYQMKFDGTETLNGKTYHKFVYVGDIEKMTDRLTTEGRKFWKYEKTKNTNRHYFLMREENGKVYTCLKYAGAYHQLDGEFFSYDFNLKKEDKFDGLAYYDNEYFDLIDFEDARIASIGEATIDGETCKVQIFSDFGDRECKKTATEGIGFNYGMLPAMDGVEMYASGRFPLIRLNKVYDGKGKVIYRGYDKTLGVNEMMADYCDLEIRMKEDAIRVAAEGNIRMTVWSMQGLKVAGAEGAGEVSVSTSGLIPGVYVVRAASADGRSATRKIVVR